MSKWSYLFLEFTTMSMSFVFFIASEHIQNVGQVPTDTKYSYSLYQVLVFP